MGDNGFAAQPDFIEKSGGRNTEPPSFKVAPFVKKQKRLVQIQKSRPDAILFLCEHLSRFRKQFESLNRSSLLSEGASFIRKCFRGLITHALRLESQVTFMGDDACFLTQI